MKLTTLMAKAIFILSPFFLFLSCSDDNSESPSTPDFGIISSETFEIISTYENGWIQEAIAYDYNGNIITELEYHANGFIKSCVTYIPRINDIPVLSRSVTRDENNKPIQSIYYNADGSILAEINYQNGLIKDKTVNKPGYTIVSSYLDGVLQKQVSTSDESIINTINYDNANFERQLMVIEEGLLSYEAILPLLPVAGEGVNTTSDLAQMNRFEDQDVNEQTLNSSFSSSIDWEGLYDLREAQPPSQVFDLTPTIDLPHGYFSSSYDFYRTVIEQYPFVESELILGKFYYLEKVLSAKKSIALSEEISNEIAADPEAFHLQYGDQYLSDIVMGKFGYVIGTVRNLPTDLQLRNQIKDLAYKKANYLLGSTIALTDDEDAILNNVFFELKYFSPALGTDGIVIKTPEDYESIVTLLTSAESWNIQEVYEGFE